MSILKGIHWQHCGGWRPGEEAVDPVEWGTSTYSVSRLWKDKAVRLHLRTLHSTIGFSWEKKFFVCLFSSMGIYFFLNGKNKLWFDRRIWAKSLNVLLRDTHESSACTLRISDVTKCIFIYFLIHNHISFFMHFIFYAFYLCTRYCYKCSTSINYFNSHNT